MKKKQLNELREKKNTDLEKQLKEMEEQLLKTKSEVLSGKVKNKRITKDLRKNIAQIKTILKEKNV